MIKKWISAYRVSFIRTIVYMLQASEYNLKDYFSWLIRVKSFKSVMYRKSLVLTTKTKLLLFILWLMIALGILAATVVGLSVQFPVIYKMFILAALFILMPVLISFGITIPLWLGNIFIQKPREKIIISKARSRLNDNKAIKIAIAGSFGKTTMREILLSVLGAGKSVVAPPGSYNTPMGVSKFINTLSGSEDIIIFELGEYYPGDVKFLAEIVKPDIGVITGVNEAHLSKFKNIENTQATIFELADYLNGSKLYVNGENELAKQKSKFYDSVLYSSKGCGQWIVNSSSTSLSGIDFVVSNKVKSLNLHSNLLGSHLLGSLLCAIEIAHQLGLKDDEIIKGVANTDSFEHRMQPKNIGGAIVIDDTYNGNFDGVIAGLNLLKSLKAKRKIYVTPGLVEQGSKSHEVHNKIGQKIGEVNPDIVVLMKNSVTGYIVEGLKKAQYEGSLRIEDDPKNFYENINMFVSKDDVVLMQNDWPDSYN